MPCSAVSSPRRSNVSADMGGGSLSAWTVPATRPSPLATGITEVVSIGAGNIRAIAGALDGLAAAVPLEPRAKRRARCF